MDLLCLCKPHKIALRVIYKPLVANPSCNHVIYYKNYFLTNKKFKKFYYYDVHILIIINK